MEKLGWLRGSLHDNGDYRVHYKYFAKANITTIVGEYESVVVNESSTYGDDAINGCLFVLGECRTPGEYPTPGSSYSKYLKAKHLLLAEVEPLVMSEVLRDLYIVTSKAK